ncbi:MAG: hypothetical protein WCR52_10965 [Bacteroidota bacterium]
MKFPYSQMLLPLCLFCSFNAKGQHVIDPQRIAQINASIDIELLAEEQNWMGGQNPIENDEMEFHRDTFRINRTKCNLLNDWENMNMTYCISVYEYSAARYAELIDKYDALMRKCWYKKYRKTYIRSQKLWVAYQKQLLSLYGSPNEKNFERSAKKLEMNKIRLGEIYNFYTDLLEEGGISNE